MKWIETKDLPPKAGYYLVADSFSRLVGMARFMPQKNIWKFPSAKMAFEVTHWAYLPDAPVVIPLT